MSSTEPTVPESPVGGPARPSHVSPVSLVDVAGWLRLSPHGVPAVGLTGVSLGSASVRPGDLYAALPGVRTHGANYADAAAAAGAVAILTDAEGAELAAAAGVPLLVVDAPRAVLGSVAALIYGRPAEGLTLIGVTGTQGKTTTTQLIAAGLEGSGRRTAVIGTMGTWIDGRPVESALTTPEAPDLHALFAVMREQGVEVCAMEVSSHALVMGRVDGVVFDVAVFTNLGRDHLDFHADIDDYFAAKAQLFTPGRARSALVNADDAFGQRLAGSAQIPSRTFATNAPGAHWRALDITSDQAGSKFVVVTPAGERLSTSVALAGAFNVANALCAIAAIGESGGDAAAAAAGVASLRAVPGRMEPVDEGQDFSVIVDYAHKPDAVTAALEALRLVTAGRVIIVIGAGGDRDQGKRPLMGEFAARLADLVVVTDDNPRTEDPAHIRSEILVGARGVVGGGSVLEIADRHDAIRHALEAARPGDSVLVAGKGHEKGQEVDGEVLPFDDKETATEILRRLAEGEGDR